MIVEERIYTLHPGQVGEYMRLYENEGFPIQENKTLLPAPWSP